MTISKNKTKLKYVIYFQGKIDFKNAIIKYNCGKYKKIIIQINTSLHDTPISLV